MWFFIALLSACALGGAAVLDKIILQKTVSKPVVYTFYSTIFLFGALVLFPLSGKFLHSHDWIIALISGLSFGFALQSFYTALKYGEASHLSPFTGAGIACLLALFSFIFLNERLSGAQIAGLVSFVVGAFFLSFQKMKVKPSKNSYTWAFLAILFFSCSHLTSKYLYEQYDFWTAFVWTRAAIGFVGVLLLLSPSVRNTFRKKKQTKKTSQKHTFSLVASNKILGALGVFGLQYATALGSVALVNAVGNVQYALVFLVAYVGMKTHSKIFQEYFTRKEIVLQLIGIFFILLGSYFISLTVLS